MNSLSVQDNDRETRGNLPWSLIPIPIIAQIAHTLPIYDFITLCTTCKVYRTSTYIKFYQTLTRLLFPHYLKHPSRLAQSEPLWRERLQHLKQKSKPIVLELTNEQYAEYVAVGVLPEVAKLMALEHFGIPGTIVSFEILWSFIFVYYKLMLIFRNQEAFWSVFRSMVGSKRVTLPHTVQTFDEIMVSGMNNLDKLKILVSLITVGPAELKESAKEGIITYDMNSYKRFMIEMSDFVRDFYLPPVEDDSGLTVAEKLILSNQNLLNRWLENGFSL